MQEYDKQQQEKSELFLPQADEQQPFNESNKDEEDNHDLIRLQPVLVDQNDEDDREEHNAEAILKNSSIPQQDTEGENAWMDKEDYSETAKQEVQQEAMNQVVLHEATKEDTNKLSPQLITEAKLGQHEDKPQHEKRESVRKTLAPMRAILATRRVIYGKIRAIFTIFKKILLE